MASSAASILANNVHFFSEDPIPTSTHSLKSESESDPAIVATTPYPVNYTPSIGCKKTTTLKSRVASGETLYGLFLMSASPTIAEIAGLSGYDFVVVDMEHGPGGISDALSCIRALAAAGTAAIIRVPEKSAAWTKKALDLGPQGIMFPMVENGSMAEQVVSCKVVSQTMAETNFSVFRFGRLQFGKRVAWLSIHERALARTVCPIQKVPLQVKRCLYKLQFVRNCGCRFVL